jgi:hypothetical protein
MTLSPVFKGGEIHPLLDMQSAPSFQNDEFELGRSGLNRFRKPLDNTLAQQGLAMIGEDGLVIEQLWDSLQVVDQWLAALDDRDGFQDRNPPGDVFAGPGEDLSANSALNRPFR